MLPCKINFIFSVTAIGDEKSSEKEDNDDNQDESDGDEDCDTVTMETDSQDVDEGEITTNGHKQESEVDDEEEGSLNTENGEYDKNIMVDEEEIKQEEKTENMEESEKISDTKHIMDKQECSKESSRSETPPLKRLMRQDPLPLFMNNHHHSPPKKMFKEEHIHSSKWQVPLIPTPAFLSNVKNAPMHPRQHMLKSKPYSNRLFLSPSAVSSFHSMGYQPNLKVYDDQPLDLSKKTGSGKSSSSSVSYSPGSSKLTSSHIAENIHLKSRHKYSNGMFPDSVKSSLQSLQQKFGGDYHTRQLQKPVKGLHPLSYEMFNKTFCGDNVLLNSISSLPKKKSPIPPFTETSEKSMSEKSESSFNNHKDLNSNFKKQNSSNDNEDDKYTRHKCVCTKTFTSLYDLSLHIQETGHLPAGVKKANLMEYPKLVRGQDMWLNTESEQTKRILRCMQCGESFKSLPMLTVHMMQTQHYTKIVSSEHGRRTHKCSAYCDRDVDRECVFKCKVCNSMFVDMEGLANHMILSGHHKRNILRTQNHTAELSLKQNIQQYLPVSEESTERDTRKKSLSRSSPPQDRLSASSPESDLMDDSMISCENCGDKIETSSFVEHVRACLHQSMVDAFESRIQKLKSKVDNLQSKNVREENKNFEVDLIETSNGKDSENLKSRIVKLESSEKKDLKHEVHSDIKQELINQDSLTDTPEKLNNIKTEPIELNENQKSSEKNQNDKSEDRNPLKSDSVKMLDILNPEDEGTDRGGNSALQAMESFIQKSFSSKFTYGKNKFQVNMFDKQESLSPLLKFEKYRKYFQPSLMMENTSKKPEESEINDSEADDSTKDELEKLEKLCENVNKRQTSPKQSTKSETAELKETKVTSESLSSKYLNIDEEGQNAEKSSSALDSLSSFVYGQALDSEHPLDKLQKLIIKTDIPGMSSSSRTILNGSPEVSVPLNLSVKREIDEDDLVEDGISEGSHSDSGSDSAVEYHCVACSRHFASKGTYRYHLSRCHLSTIKKYGIKEAFNMSPYVYLPLDHTAKFSKYFKMAEELVKKEKL